MSAITGIKFNTKGTMETSLQKTESSSLAEVNLPVDIAWPDLQAAIAGNLNKLSAEGQVKYYNALCKFTGLNPLGFPFEWITFQGKLRLYPKKECADQLRGVHKISAKILDRTFFEDICMVRVLSTMPDGRQFESTGAVPYSKTMAPLDKCKALKVAETQAYRRGTFGLVGLGNLPDEDSERAEPARVRIDTALEESVEARLEKLNTLSAPKPIEAELVKDEPQKETSEPVLETFSADAPQQAPPPQADGKPELTPQPAASGLPDSKVVELETLFAENKSCVPFLVFKGYIKKGETLSAMAMEKADYILRNARAFLRNVESWARGQQ